MRVAFVLFAWPCFAVGITGTWASHSGVPIAVQIDQEGDRLRVLKIVAGDGGKYLEKFSVDAAALKSTPHGVEIRMPCETWIVTTSGKLLINRRGQRLVLRRAVKEPVR